MYRNSGMSLAVREYAVPQNIYNALNSNQCESRRHIFGKINRRISMKLHKYFRKTLNTDPQPEMCRSM